MLFTSQIVVAFAWGILADSRKHLISGDTPMDRICWDPMIAIFGSASVVFAFAGLAGGHALRCSGPTLCARPPPSSHNASLHLFRRWWLLHFWVGNSTCSFGFFLRAGCIRLSRLAPLEVQWSLYHCSEVEAVARSAVAIWASDYSVRSLLQGTASSPTRTPSARTVATSAMPCLLWSRQTRKLWPTLHYHLDSTVFRQTIPASCQEYWIYTWLPCRLRAWNCVRLALSAASQISSASQLPGDSKIFDRFETLKAYNSQGLRS